MKKRILSLLLALCMILSMAPMPVHVHAAAANEDAVTLPRYLYVGGVEVITEYNVGAVTSGTGWRYDADTATLYLTDGADIRYTSTTEESLENGLYCNGGTLKVHASGTVSITGYGDGIRLPDGSLDLYAAEGANVTITGTSAGGEGINSTVNTNFIRLSGKGTVNVHASDGATYGMTAAGSIIIDGVTLNVRGTSNYDDISAASILIGQTEAAVVNCLGTTCSGIGGTQAQKVGIYNGSTVYIGEKISDKSWLVGISSKTIEIVDSTLIMDGITGTYSIYALHGTSTVSGNSHILIRKMVSTEDSTCGLTVGYSPYELTAESDYYIRTNSAEEFVKNGDVEELYISYFELYTASHHSYHSNGDGTHYYGCPAVCPAAIKGASEECSGTYQDLGNGKHSFTCEDCGTVTEDHSTTSEGDRAATCAAPAYCSVCDSEYGDVDKTHHDETVAYENGFCPNCDAYEPARLVDGVYQISNAGNLYWFADKVFNDNTNYRSAHAVLTANITVNENVLKSDGTLNGDGSNFRLWMPIGTFGLFDGEVKRYPYIGTFDGQGYTVSGLYFHDNSADMNIGLFGTVIQGGIVRNVGVVDSYFRNQSGVGGVVGYINRSAITGCYNTGTVIGDSAGGVVGANVDGTVTDCYNEGNVSGNSYVGGVVGSNDGTVTDCYNEGNISGTTDVGGVAGYNNGPVSNCYNKGNVRGSSIVGGVLGSSGRTAYNCYNEGTVTGDSEVGGIVGLTGNGTISNCYNKGTVSGNSNVGGVAGENHINFTLANCYFDSTAYSGEAIGLNNGAATDVEGKSTEEFASGEVAYLLSQGCTLEEEGETVTYPGDIWGQKIGTEDYPVLGGEKVYYGYLSCSDAEKIYTNDSSASAEKPAHSGPYTAAFTWPEHIQDYLYVNAVVTCTACGDTVYTDSAEAGLDGTVEGTDCLNPGSATYSVTITYQDTEYTDTHTYTVKNENHVGQWDNGFCTACGGYQAAVYNEEKGVYEISNAGQLYWYAQKLNTENAEIYAELTADIVIPESAPNWEPINASYAFFNGNYHTISGLKCVGGESTYVGLFGCEGWWYEISNLHIEDSYFEGNGYVGALVACMTNGGSVTNCYVTNTTVKGGNDTGGLVGYLGNSTMSNCYSAAAVEGENAHTLVGYYNSYATVENCYYLSETETEDGGRTAAQFASGEVAYLLQGDQEAHIWGQTIGTEDYPVFGGRKVLFDQETNTYYNDTATLGDLDLDGDVDAYDLTLLARHVGGIEPLTGQALLNANVDGNTDVDAYDLTKHARYVGGIITSWDQE